MTTASARRPLIRPRGALRDLPVERLILPALLIIAALQAFINYHTWLISGPAHMYFMRHLNTHPLPYIDQRIEYPVLTGVFMTIASGLTNTLHGFLELNSLMLGACSLGCVWVLWTMSRRAAIAYALCPLLLVYSLANWDVFAILLMLLGWRAYTRGHHARAGMWLALGTFAKLFPIFLLGGCLIALIRHWRSERTAESRDGAVRFGVAALVASLVVNLPFAIPAFHNWEWFWTFNADRTNHADLLSWLHLMNHASLHTENLALTGLVLVAVAAGAVAIWRGAGVAHVAALCFVVFMVMEKVYSPQYTLWIYVYALLAAWDLWALVALTIMGLVVDASAATGIALRFGTPAGQHFNTGPPLQRWYQGTMQYREQGLRLLGTVAIGLAMLVRRIPGAMSWLRRVTAMPASDATPR